MREQLFHCGDRVRIIAEHAGAPIGTELLIQYSYHDQYGGGGEHPTYSALFCESGASQAWFDQGYLELVTRGTPADVEALRAWRKTENEKQSQLPWILERWKSSGGKLPGASVWALMLHIGISDPWGAYGEGVVLYQNQRLALAVCNAALDAGDLEALEALKDAAKGHAFDLTRPIGLDADAYAAKHGDGVAYIQQGVKHPSTR